MSIDTPTAAPQARVAGSGAPPVETDLPPSLRSRFNGQLDGQTVIAWAEFDIDSTNRYRQQYAVLTGEKLLVLDGQSVTVIHITEIEEAKISEGLGVDRLNLIIAGKLAHELRYSRRQRRDMTRLHRKLERRMPKKENGEVPPDWLENVEREVEKKERCAKCGEFIPSYAEGVCPRCLQSRAILWRLMGVAKQYRKHLAFALFLTLLTSSVTTLPNIFQRYLVDRAIAPHLWLQQAQGQNVPDVSISDRLGALFFWASAILIATALTELIGTLRMWILTKIGTSVTRDLRHAVYSHMHELSLRYFAKRRTGSLITRVTNDTDRLWDFIVFGSVNMVRDIAMMLLTAGIMLFFNPKLAGVALLPLPLVAIVSYYRGRKMQRIFGRLWTYWARMSAVVGDALPGVRVVKAFANEDREIARFDDRNSEYTLKEQEVNKVWVSLMPVVSILMRLGSMMVWVYGGYLIIRYPSEENSLGTLMMFSSFLWMFYGPVMELANSGRMVTRAATSAQRVFEVLDTPPEIYSRTGALTKGRLDGRVEFRQVSFSYEGAQPALREVSLHVEPGEMIGLCGPSGAGKSTLVNLICRFYDATDGQILIDGVDIRDYDVQWLRRQVGVVLQEPYLFHGTIADNIRYGNPDATDEQVIRAARAANAHDFIVGFPDGYDTMVGERGQSLSGGERQRISIARAILHDPRILILDEATSSVDTETEKQIQQALDRLVEGRTTFAIAHRLSTLQAADRLIVLERGKIAEQGQHADLVNKENGVYAKLHKTQVEMSSLVAIR